MPAYVIIVREFTHDKSELKRYSDKAKAVKDRNYTVRALGRVEEILEGDPVEAVGILEFDDLEAARNWYYSPDYQDALIHRLKGGAFRTVLVQGRD